MDCTMRTAVSEPSNAARITDRKIGKPGACSGYTGQKDPSLTSAPAHPR
jgi:hypothetical protein